MISTPRIDSLKRMGLFLMALIVPVAAVTATARATLAARVRAQAPSPELIDAPDRWVPFQAEVTITHPGESIIHGRFYRSSNGSRRIESGPALDDIRIISIANLSTETGYIFNSARKQWRSFSLTGELTEAPRFRKNPTWTLHPARLAVRVGESGALDAPVGLQAYRAVDIWGTVTFKVPELNLFSVISMRPDGRYEHYTNVDVGREPDPQLFAPAAGDLVVPGDPPGKQQ